MNIEKYSADVRTMGESVKAAAIPGKQNEGYVEAEALSEVTSGEAEAIPEKPLMLLKICMQKKLIILN